MANNRKDPEKKKGTHTISATPLEWARLQELAKVAGMGISEYVIKKLKLS